jgi:hypothetical protein
MHGGAVDNAAVNRMEDLRVNVCEEATNSDIGKVCLCYKTFATDRARSQG